MTPPPDNGPNKRDRREEAREKARKAREAAARKKKRNKIFTQGGIGLGVLAVIAVVILVIMNSIQPAGPGPKNMASDGILLKGNSSGEITATKTAATASGAKPKATNQKKLDKTVNITIYQDFQCPICEQFETANSSQIKTWLQKGAVTYEIHPISILDPSSLGNKYSTRSTNAAACVANYAPNKFLDLNAAFYADQPAEQTNGRTDAQILATMKKAGISSSAITSCVKDEKFTSWVGDETNRALNDKLPNSSVAKVTGTPTVIVNGKQYQGSVSDAATFAQFVTSAATS